MTPPAEPHETAPEAWLEGRVSLVRAPRFDDERGSLVPFEQMPFPPHRVFVIRDVPRETIRGRHAHREQRQVLICLSGAVEVDIRLHDRRQSIVLNDPQTGLLIEPGVWSSLRFITDDSVLLGLASGDYDPEGYVARDADRVG